MTYILVCAAKTARQPLPPSTLLARPTHDENFPIDVVSTWVDGNDAAWRSSLYKTYGTERERNSHLEPYHSPMREPGVAPAHDELYYSVHSIAKFMPWVRTYHLVTQRPHKPKWWVPAIGNMRLVLVHHDEIWRHPSLHLPVFNSNAIISQLVNIPNLAEHFILFDDDCFVGQPMTRPNFFTSAGAPVLRTRVMKPDNMPVGNWRRQVENLHSLLINDLGQISVHSPVHVCSTHLKSVFDRVLSKEYPDAIRKLRPFRSNVDVPTQYLVLGWMHAHNMLAPLPPNILTTFVNTGRLSEYEAFVPHLFCINDRLADSDFVSLQNILSKPS